MVVFGAASFIKPGFMPNYLYLAIDYMKRPRCDVLEMISQNKGVFGFNLIWYASVRTRGRQPSLQPHCMMTQDVGQNGAHAGNVRRHVSAGAFATHHAVLSSINRGADAMASPARWTHAALPQCRSSADLASKRQDNRKSAARSEPAVNRQKIKSCLASFLTARAAVHGVCTHS